ncbi:MAG: hydrogenase maturation protease [Chloroflexi bacterium]|nr:hydrogenase maturation protease [Chloroflexota bacterium]
MKVLVLGVGNLIMSDDGVGIRTVQLLQEKCLPSFVDCQTAALTGINLLDLLEGYDKAYIADSIVCSNQPDGTVLRFSAKELDDLKQNQYSHHNLGLLNTLAFGRQNGLDMPQDITVYAVCAQNVTTFGEELSPKVLKGAIKASEMLNAELQTLLN